MWKFPHKLYLIIFLLDVRNTTLKIKVKQRVKRIEAIVDFHLS